MIEWKENYNKPSTMQEVLKNVMADKNMSKDKFIDFIKINIKPVSPFALTNMEKCINEIKKHKKIFIIGDYDCDGITATSIMYIGLKQYGFDVITRLPDRINDGYGAKCYMVDEALDAGCDCIITVDNGIAAIDVYEYANNKGIAFIVTDHHQPGDKLPGQFVIDPWTTDEYPMKSICGALVAYKFIHALLQDDSGNIDTDLDKELISLAAIATVADIMELVGENRYYVSEGLKYIVASDNEGIKALLKESKINKNSFCAEDIAFRLAPAINSAGRLKNPGIALKLILTDDVVEATGYAKELIKLNNIRKEKTREVMNNVDINENDKVLIVTLKDIGAGLLGPIASSIAEHYHKPCFALAEHDGILSGSGRSANGYDIFNVINNNRDFLSGGGHKQAAGVKLSDENIDKFKKLCNEDYIGFEKTAGVNVVTKDAVCELDVGLITDRLINNLNQLEPYGKGNEKPLFILKHVRLNNISFIGKNESTIKFIAYMGNNYVDAIGFSNICDKYKELGKPDKLDILCTIGYNTWMGRNTRQIMIEDIRLPESYGSEDLDLHRL